MERDGRFQGTLHHIYAHWPAYLFLYGGGFALIIVVTMTAAERAWWAMVALALAALLVLGYFFGASLWAAHELYDRREQEPAQLLFRMGQLKPADEFVHVGLGRRRTAVRLSRRLMSGRLTVVDVYNPQLTPSRTLARARLTLQQLEPDPRLTWLEGNIELLPLPDHCTQVVTMNRVLSELWQHGDRMLLLEEVYRILRPGGRLLLIEPVRTQRSWLVWGPAALRLQPLPYWQRLFRKGGFNLKKEESLNGLAHCFALQRPEPGEMQQLTFDFGL